MSEAAMERARLLAPVMKLARLVPESSRPAVDRALKDLAAMLLASLARGERCERRLTELEAVPRLRFLGVHEPGRTYLPGNLVVRNGGLWHCHATTNETPGKSSHWQLAVKSGEAKRVSGA